MRIKVMITKDKMLFNQILPLVSQQSSEQLGVKGAFTPGIKPPVESVEETLK